MSFTRRGPSPAQRFALFAVAVIALALCPAAQGATSDLTAASNAGSDLKACLKRTVQRFSNTTAGPAPALVFRGAANYEAATKVWNARFAPQPLALFYAHRVEHVQAAVKCGRHWGVPVSPAGGRHGFLGSALVTDGLTVDMSNLTKIEIDASKGVVEVGTGSLGAMVTTALREKGPPGAVFPAGDCPWVGVAGYNLGGGIGMLSRYLGLGCDQLVGLTMVDANGDVVTASKTQNSDLLWASCGGGGGTFGIVTKFQFRLRVLPNNGSVTVVNVQYKSGVEAMVQAYMRYQEWFPKMDSRFGGMIKWENQAMRLQFVFVGPPAEAKALLKAGGMLSLPLDSAIFTPAPTYFEYVKYYVENFWLAGEAAAQPPGTDLQDFFLRSMRGEPGYRVQPAASPSWVYARNHVVRKLPLEAVQALAEMTAGAQAAVEGTGATFMVHWWQLGGQIAKVAPSGTAFPHRRAWAVMAMEFFTDQNFKYVPRADQAKYTSVVRGLTRIVEQYLPANKPQYNNYLNDEPGWKLGFFGTNYWRLSEIKKKYDPTNLFGKPYTVRPAKAVA